MKNKIAILSLALAVFSGSLSNLDAACYTRKAAENHRAENNGNKKARKALESKVEMPYKPNNMKVAEVAGDKAFAKDVLKSDKPVIVKFHAVWCSVCKGMKPIDESLAKKYYHQMKIVQVDIDGKNNKALIEKYGVKGVPTYVFFRGGNEMKDHRFVGAKTENQFDKVIKSFTAQERAQSRTLIKSYNSKKHALARPHKSKSSKKQKKNS